MSPVTKRITALALGVMFVGAASASAELHHRAVVVVPRVAFYDPYLYSPFWGPWGPWYPYVRAYPYSAELRADVRTDVTPKTAEIFVDGYYAGHASDFGGVFKRLHVVPGGHAITLHLDGFRTVTENIYVTPDSTYKLHVAMERLAPGETSAPVKGPTPPVH